MKNAAPTAFRVTVAIGLLGALLTTGCGSLGDDQQLGQFATGGTDDDNSGPPGPGDRVIHLARAPGPSFIEFTEVRWTGDQVLACSPLLGLLHYDARDASDPSGETPVPVPGFHEDYPRCQRISVQGDRALVAAKADQVQTSPVVALLDISDPGAPRVVDALTLSDQIDGIAWFGGRPVVAAHEAGVLRLSADGGELKTGDRARDLGNVRAVARVGGLLAAGTLDGTVHFLDTDLKSVDSVGVDGGVQALAALPDGRVAVAMGSAGIALVAPPVDGDAARVTGTTQTRGTAVRLGVLGDGSLAVANWQDVRVFDTSGDAPVLAAVEDMTVSQDRPRTLALDAFDDRIVVGEWSGLHFFHHDPSRIAAEIHTDERRVQLAGPSSGRTARIEVDNEGQLPLTVGTIDAPVNWNVRGGDVTLQPGESATVEVEYVGEAPMDRHTLEIPSDDPDEPTTRVELAFGSTGLAPGERAPDLVALGINTGETHDLLDSQGRVVVVSYFGTFCPVCSTGFPDLEREVQQAYGRDRVQVYGVNANLHPGEMDGLVLDFVEQTGVTFPVVYDLGGTYWMYERPEDDTAPFPLNVVIAPDGTIAFVQVEQDMDALAAAIDALLP